MNPRVKRVSASSDHKVHVEFTNGVRGVDGCSPILDFGAFRESKVLNYFKQARILDGTVACQSILIAKLSPEALSTRFVIMVDNELDLASLHSRYKNDATVEPVFGNLRGNKRLGRFTLQRMLTMRCAAQNWVFLHRR